MNIGVKKPYGCGIASYKKPAIKPPGNHPIDRKIAIELYTLLFRSGSTFVNNAMVDGIHNAIENPNAILAIIINTK